MKFSKTFNAQNYENVPRLETVKRTSWIKLNPLIKALTLLKTFCLLFRHLLFFVFFFSYFPIFPFLCEKRLISWCKIGYLLLSFFIGKHNLMLKTEYRYEPILYSSLLRHCKMIDGSYATI